MPVRLGGLLIQPYVVFGVTSLLLELQQGAADAEMKDASVEDPHLKRSPWSMSEYSPARFAYCLEFPPC